MTAAIFIIIFSTVFLQTSGKNDDNVVHLSAFIESQCPDCTKFVNNQLVPVWSKFNKSRRLEVKIIPFGNADCESVGDDFSCDCQHGEQECFLNELMNCAIDILKDPRDHLPVIFCLEGKQNRDVGIKECLLRHQQIPVHEIMECGATEKGRRLLAEAGNVTRSLRPLLHYVPWVLLDDKYSQSAENNLLETLCNKWKPKPPECY